MASSNQAVLVSSDTDRLVHVYPNAATPVGQTWHAPGTGAVVAKPLAECHFCGLAACTQRLLVPSCKVVVHATP